MATTSELKQQEDFDILQNIEDAPAQEAQNDAQVESVEATPAPKAQEETAAVSQTAQVEPLEVTPPKPQTQEERLRGATSYSEVLKILNEGDPTPEDKEADAKSAKSKALVKALGDSFSTLANLHYTTKGAAGNSNPVGVSGAYANKLRDMANKREQLLKERRAAKITAAMGDLQSRQGAAAAAAKMKADAEEAERQRKGSERLAQLKIDADAAAAKGAAAEAELQREYAAEQARLKREHDADQGAKSRSNQYAIANLRNKGGNEDPLDRSEIDDELFDYAVRYGFVPADGEKRYVDRVVTVKGKDGKTETQQVQDEEVFNRYDAAAGEQTSAMRFGQLAKDLTEMGLPDYGIQYGLDLFSNGTMSPEEVKVKARELYAEKMRTDYLDSDEMGQVDYSQFED